MPSIEDHVTEIEVELAKGHREEPERLLRRLISQLGMQELEEWSLELRKLVDRFLPKRRRALEQTLVDALVGPTVQTAPESSPADDERADHAFDAIALALHEDLQFLSARHIYQWTTAYRDTLVPHLNALLATQPATEARALLRRELAEHSFDIFDKGYRYSTVERGVPSKIAGRTYMNGLGKFVDLLIEYYSALASTGLMALESRNLRSLVSAAIAGVLEGYGTVQFGHDAGWELLPSLPLSWAHYIPFLTHSDFAALLVKIDEGPFQAGLAASVLPVLEAIDKIGEQPGARYIAAPALGQYVNDQRRLDVALRPPADAAEAAPKPHRVELSLFDSLEDNEDSPGVS